MALKSSQYDMIMRDYEQKQLHNRNVLEERYQKVYSRIPEYKDLDDSIAILSVQYGKKLLNGDDHAVTSLKEELAILRNSKEHLLESAGFPAGYLDPVYTCPDCQDTGYIGNKKCHCFKKAITNLLYAQSNLQEILKIENFDTFSLDYYSKNHIDPKSKRSSYDIMEDALAACKNFVTTFGTDFQNLFLYGDTGIGKTFLSNCIAKALMDEAFSVIYFSASELFHVMAQSTFDKDVDATNMYDYIFNCDLLIIDDLGTELTNSFVTSQLFSCVNDRLLDRKSTIISTNLSLESLVDIYSERTFSRITSNYTMLKLVGDDIRLKKKLRNVQSKTK
ncbi:ATP-binding protein [Hespellia stercorisuis]|uniref:DNA replication protein DnaC n=1 Tax=Hespellia stercorisuis DSM 15480 TaxID=1121950 RepID=A0A1M6J3E6_9FIRM|nr:ATP-binding protein [Hespellia stercorisuis]SHJ41255.1 DNA replication protein DnaC [Hespellia stercorisuis DSM 15480]